ncbi:MAG TPA: hypothetical protein VGF54_06460, partial [Streptosporangiaceae bacterium]
EQAEGREVGPASDVFSLGAVLAFAATGQGPFGTGATPALLYRVVYQQADTAHLPGAIRPLVERCLAKDPGQRPATTDLLDELGNAQPTHDWLPAPVTEVLSRYAPPPAAGASGPPTETSAQARRAPTVTSAEARQAPTQAAFWAQPGAAGGQPPRKNRRGLAWALLATGLLAVLVAAAILGPRVMGDLLVSHTPQPAQSGPLSSPPSPPPQTGGAVSQSATPAAVSPSPPAQSQSPVTAQSSAATETPTVTGSPAATETPTATGSPTATETPTATGSQTATDAPTATQPPATSSP